MFFSFNPLSSQAGRRMFYICFLLSVLILVNCSGTQLVQQVTLTADSTASVFGLVGDSETGDNVAAVNAFLVYTNGDVTPQGSFTDIDGIYQINDILPGSYYLILTAMGYSKTVSDSFILRAGQSIRKDFLITEAVLLPFGIHDKLWPQLNHSYNVDIISTETDSFDRRQLPINMLDVPQEILPPLLPIEESMRWEYKTKIYTRSGAAIDSGTTTWDFQKAHDFDIEECVGLEEYHIESQDIIAGPWWVNVSGINSLGTGSFILFETPKGLFRSRFLDFDADMAELFLPREQEIGSIFGWFRYRIADMDTVLINGDKRNVVEIQWHHVPDYGETYRYRWIIGLGLLEMLESRSVTMGDWPFESFSQYYIYNHLLIVSR